MQRPAELKKALRAKMIALLKAITKERRMRAKEAAVSFLLQQLHAYPTIFSFSSRPFELDLWKLNATLAEQTRLALPRVEGEHLQFYLVRDLESDLVLSSLGIFEPIPSRCQKINATDKCCILIPAIVFDATLHRLGNGKGHYDRFLHECPAKRYGVGFMEQKVDGLIPTEDFDERVEELFFFWFYRATENAVVRSVLLFF